MKISTSIILSLLRLDLILPNHLSVFSNISHPLHTFHGLVFFTVLRIRILKYSTTDTNFKYQFLPLFLYLFLMFNSTLNPHPLSLSLSLIISSFYIIYLYIFLSVCIILSFHRILSIHIILSLFYFKLLCIPVVKEQFLIFDELLVLEMFLVCHKYFEYDRAEHRIHL